MAQEDHDCIQEKRITRLEKSIDEKEIGGLVEFKDNAKNKINELDDRVDRLERCFVEIRKDIKFLKKIRKEEMLWIRGIGVAITGFIGIFLIKTIIFRM